MLRRFTDTKSPPRWKCLSFSPCRSLPHKASHALICKSLESMTNVHWKFQSVPPPKAFAFAPHPHPFCDTQSYCTDWTRCWALAPRVVAFHPGKVAQISDYVQCKTVCTAHNHCLFFFKVCFKGWQQVSTGCWNQLRTFAVVQRLERMFDGNPKTKGVLSTTLIPKEHFGPRVGITGDFNHVMGHQALVYSISLCV